LNLTEDLKTAPQTSWSAGFFHDENFMIPAGFRSVSVQVPDVIVTTSRPSRVCVDARK